MSEPRLLPADALEVLEVVMRKGAENHDPPDSWKDQTVGEHLEHSAIHQKLHALGDTSEPHLFHSACRQILAVAVFLRSAKDGSAREDADAAVPPNC